MLTTPREAVTQDEADGTWSEKATPIAVSCYPAAVTATPGNGIATTRQADVTSPYAEKRTQI